MVARAGGAALAAAAFALLAPAPGASAAQVLGIVYPEACGFYDAATESLRAQLAAAGFGPGTLEIYVQKPSADPMSWANALRKFDAVEADLIVIWGDSLLQTACREKVKRPIGYGFVLEPGLSACARSAANPGGVAAGVSAKTPLATLLAKARLMAEFTSVGVFRFPGDRVGEAAAEELRGIGRDLGFAVREIAAPRREDALAAFEAAAAEVGLLLLPGCPLVAGQIEALLAAAAGRGVPTVSLQPPRGPAAAALLSLYPSPEEQGRLLGEIAVTVLRKGPGAAPSAPAAPKRIELEVNLPLARQLGLKVPMALLDAATKIIR